MCTIIYKQIVRTMCTIIRTLTTKYLGAKTFGENTLGEKISVTFRRISVQLFFGYNSRFWISGLASI